MSIKTKSLSQRRKGAKRFSKLEVVSKFQIRHKGKAPGRSGKRSILGYVSIYRRPATRPLGLRWDVETTSRILGVIGTQIGGININDRIFGFNLKPGRRKPFKADRHWCLIKRKFFPEVLFIILPLGAELLFEKSTHAIIPATPGVLTQFFSLKNVV